MWVALEGNKDPLINGYFRWGMVGQNQGLSVEQLGGFVSCLEKMLRYVASFVTQAN